MGTLVIINGDYPCTLDISVYAIIAACKNNGIQFRWKVYKPELLFCDIDDTDSHRHPGAHKRLFITVPGLKRQWAEGYTNKLKKEVEDGGE